MFKQFAVAFTALSVLAPLPGSARPMQTNDAAIVQSVTPAVVNISSWKLLPASNPGEPARRVKIYASGFVIAPSGLVVTNKHVVDGALDLHVIFNNGERLRAKVVSAAAMLDVAVLQVDANHPLPALKWGDSDALQVGDPVLTIGNPLGIGMSVSSGIVSALNRDLKDTPFDSYIQTDAAINHGNSGGPLIDRDGNVVGIDTALYNPEQNGGFIGIGFAIPSDSARFVVNFLLDPRHPKPGWLGFTLQDMNEQLAEALGYPRISGAIVAAVDPAGPAHLATLRQGDVLVKLDGTEMDDSRAFMRAIVQLPVGTPVHLTVWRDNRQQEVTATVQQWPNYMPGGGVMHGDPARAMAEKEPDPGVKLASLTPDVRKEFDLDPKVTGVAITAVEPDCEARDLGIVPGDVVVAVQGELVSTPDEVSRAVREAHQERRPYLALLIQAKAVARWVALSIGSPGAY